MNDMQRLIYNLSRFNRNMEKIRESLSNVLGVDVVSGIMVGTIIRDANILNILSRTGCEVFAFRFNGKDGVALIEFETLDSMMGFTKSETSMRDLKASTEAFKELHRISNLLIITLNMDKTFNVEFDFIGYKLKFGNSSEYFKSQITHVISEGEMVFSKCDYDINEIGETFVSDMKELSNIIDTRASMLSGDIVLYTGVSWRDFETLVGRPYDHDTDFNLKFLSDIEFYTHVIDMSSDYESDGWLCLKKLLELNNGRDFESISYGGRSVTSGTDLPLLLFDILKDSIDEKLSIKDFVPQGYESLSKLDEQTDCLTRLMCREVPDYITNEEYKFKRPHEIAGLGIYSDGGLRRDVSVKKFIDAMRKLCLSPILLKIVLK